jgi:cobalt/nickel transport system permease protein
MKNNIPSFLLENPSSSHYVQSKERVKVPFIERGIHQIANVIRSGYIQWESAMKGGIFQRIDARVKILFLLFFIVIVSLKKELIPQALIGGLVFVLVVLSRVDILRFYRKVLLLGFFFGFLVAFPAAINVITKGEILIPLFTLSKEYHFWIYDIPAEIGITRAGMEAVVMLTSRVTNSLALSFLVIHTTQFPDIIKALKVLRVPDGFLMVITLSYKYIFIFAKTIEDMYLAKKSRLARHIKHSEARGWIVGRIAFVFRKTQNRFEEIYKAMNSKGFSDDIKIYQYETLNAKDYAAGAVLFLIGMLLVSM